jgi:hypothetical protein
MAKPRDLAILMVLVAAAISPKAAKAEVDQEMKELAELLKEQGRPEPLANISPSSAVKTYCSGDRELKCDLSYELTFKDKDKEIILTYIDRLNPTTLERDDSVSPEDHIIIEVQNAPRMGSDMPGHFRKLFSDKGLDYKIRDSNYDYIEFRINNPSREERTLAEEIKSLYPELSFNSKFRGANFAWCSSKKQRGKGTIQIENKLRAQQRAYVRKAIKYLKSRN